MKISHNPASGRLRIGWRRPSQVLKLPTTETRLALGAQTAKRTPAMARPAASSMDMHCAPSTRPSSKCRPSEKRWRSHSPSKVPKA